MGNKRAHVVLMPTHKSLMDSILVGYIHYHYKLPYPFVSGSEAFFTLAVISVIIKSTNGFYLDEASMSNPLYRAVMDAYLRTLLKHNCLLEVFLDQWRSRTGKINQPANSVFDMLIN